jgi:hypothetical protein
MRPAKSKSRNCASVENFKVPRIEQLKFAGPQRNDLGKSLDCGRSAERLLRAP